MHIVSAGQNHKIQGPCPSIHWARAMVLVLYVGGENYQTDRDDAMSWLWGSKSHMAHRRVRAMAASDYHNRRGRSQLPIRIWRIKYPLAHVPTHWRWTALATMGASIMLILASLSLMLIKWAPAHMNFNTDWWRAALSVLSTAAGSAAGLWFYCRYYLVRGDPNRARGVYAAQPIYAEQLDHVAREIDRLRRKHQLTPAEPVVLVGNGSGGHLVALYVLRLVFAHPHQRGQWPKWLRAVITTNCIYDLEQYVRNSTLLEQYARKCIVEPAFGPSATTWRAASPAHHWVARRRALMAPELQLRWFVGADVFGEGELAAQARQFALNVLNLDERTHLELTPQMTAPHQAAYYQLLQEAIALD